MLYEQLTQGTAQFVVQADGTETVLHKPPTTLHLQAARALKQQHDQLQQLGMAHNQLQQLYEQLVNEHNYLQQLHTKNEQTTKSSIPTADSAGVSSSSS